MRVIAKPYRQKFGAEEREIPHDCDSTIDHACGAFQ